MYGAIELPIRLSVLATREGSPLNRAEAGVYVGIVAASWVGFSVGTRLRRHCDTDAVLRILYLLVAASASFFLGALEDAGVAAGFVAGGAAWSALLAVLVLRPALVTSLSSKVRGRAALK